MYNILYSIPISAIAIYTWKKNMTQSGEVKFRSMTPKMMMIATAITAVGVWAYMLLLQSMGGNLPFMDSLTTVVAVVASMLYLLRFSEQWAMWAIVNILAHRYVDHGIHARRSFCSIDYPYEGYQLT